MGYRQNEPSNAARDPQLFERIVETSRIMFTVLDPNLVITYSSSVCFDLLGYTPAELVGVPALDLVHPDDVAVAAGALDQLIGESRGRLGVGIPIEARVRASDGTYRNFEVGALMQLDDPHVEGIILRLRPIEGQAYLDLALHALVAGDPLDDVLMLLCRSISAEVSPAHATISYDWNGERFEHAVTTGLPAVLAGARDDPRPLPWRQAIETGDPAAAELSTLPADIAAEAANHGLHACWAVPVSDVDGDRTGCLIVWRADDDAPWVSHQVVLGRVAQLVALAFRHRHDAAQLVHAALHDGLTGLANRRQFFRSLDDALAVNDDVSVGVLYLDLDDFKPVNDVHGHAAGDELLTAVARRIEAVVRPDDLVARLGGDEFAVLCRGVGSADELTAIADRLVSHIQEPVQLSTSTAAVAASIGVSFSGAGGNDGQLLERADVALRAAKAAGKSTWHLAS
jgi:diguanylate cyclase (GGDEF)-like protein/PAS domain S-box-containing protein